MQKHPFTRCQLAQAAAATLALVSMVSCSLHKANKAFDEGRYDEAAMAYREILKNAPSNVTAKNGLRRASQRASDAHMEAAREARKRGAMDKEREAIRQAVLVDPTNAIATERMVEIEDEEREKREAVENGQSVDFLKQQAENDTPQLINPRSMEGVDLNFQRKTSLKEIFANLSKASGINIIMHHTFQDAQVSVDLRGLQFQKILDTLMLQNELFYRVIDPKTIVVIKDTMSNREKFENQSIKVFYLSHAKPDDVRQALTQFSSGGGGRLRAYPDKRQNAVTVRGNPKDIAIATRIIQQMDKPKAEVMVYMELLEVNQTTMEKVGIRPTSSLTGYEPSMMIRTKNAGPLGNQSTGGIKIPKADLQYILPGIIIDALKKDGDSRILASPNIRVTSDNEGSVNIGDEVSVLSSTTTGTTGTEKKPDGTTLASNTGLPVNNYSYQKVGVEIKVKPRVHHNNDVSLEINSIVSELLSSGDRPRTSKREIKTFARLRDGEVAVFAGMLKETEKDDTNGIWGLSDIPFIGKLLSNKERTKEKTDVLLTIRAVIVRKPELKAADFEPYDPSLDKVGDGPFEAIKTTPAAAPDAMAPAPTLLPTLSKPTPAPNPTTMPMATSAPIPEPPPVTAAPITGSPAESPAADAPIPMRASEAPAPKPLESAPQGNVRLFLAPTFFDLKVGERIQLFLNISNGAGLSSGSIDLQISPNLKLLSIAAGDYLTGEGGSLDQGQEKNGQVRFSFKRTGTASDSGAIALIELQAVKVGNAPVLIQANRHMAGSKPLSAQTVNSLITVK